jgi:hypothetical protein
MSMVNMFPVRQAIVHVGQTKAASTSLQNYLDSQRAALAAAGVFFPATGFTRRDPHNPERTSGHLQLFRDVAARNLDGLAAEQAALPGGPHPGTHPDRLVLSAENIFADQPDDVLRAMGAYLDGVPVQVVVIFRHPVDWVLSRHVESVTGGWMSSTDSLARFTDRLLERGTLDYPARLAHVAGCLGAAEVRAFDLAALAADPRGTVGALMDDLGLPLTDPGLARGLRQNVQARPAILVEAQRRLNLFLHGVPSAERLALTAALPGIAAAITGGDPALMAPPVMDPDLQERIVTGTQDAMDRLAEEVLGGRPLLIQDAAAVTPADPARQEAAVQAVFAAGLARAQALLRATEQGGGRRRRRSALADLAAAGLTPVLPGRARTSLHLQSTASALLAASRPGRLVIATDTGADLRLATLADTTDLASDLILLPRTPPAAQGKTDPVLVHAAQILRQERPDLVVLGAGQDAGPVLDWLEDLPGGATVVMHLDKDGQAPAVRHLAPHRPDLHQTLAG